MDENKNAGQVPPEILENLRPYKQHINRLCLECGYNGMMGVVKVKRPWYTSFWFFILLTVFIFVPIGLIMFGIDPLWTGIALGVIFGLATRNNKQIITLCPNCKKEIGG